MKIHEYDQMMKHLTRPASKYSKTEKDKIVKDHYKDSEDYFKKQKIPVHQQLTKLKDFGRNILADRPMNILKYIDTVNKNYGDNNIKIKTDAEYERLNPTKKAPVSHVTPPKKTITKTYDSPIGTIKEIKEVAPKKAAEVKSKPNGKYEMPEMKLDSFDWDLWLRDHDKDYMTLEDEDKLVSQPSIDESNATWWNNMYYDYKKSGGELNFKQFQDMLKREGDIGDLGAKKRKLEGIRKIILT